MTYRLDLLKFDMEPAHKQLTRQMTNAYARLTDESIKEALGQWVSEIEPELVYSGSKLLGVGPIGHGNPIIRCRPVEVHLTYEGARVCSFTR